MPSLKSKMINFIIRHQHLFQGRLRKETFDANTSIADFRARCEQGAGRFGTIPDGVSVQEDNIDGIKAEWLVPKGSSEDKIIMYVHGGGYVSGSCSDHRGIIAKFAQYMGVRNLLFEYRLAPEAPFPAAIDDSVKVYQWLLAKGYQPENIIIAGESAGGGLCLATLLALKEQHIPLPAAAVSISPWTDLTCSSDSYRTKNKVSPAPKDSWFVFGKHYIGDNDATNPFISPLFGEVKGLPPLFIVSGVDDELYEDGEKFASKAKAAGVDVTFRAGDGMLHCYPLLAPMFREATDAMSEIMEFVHEKLGLTTEPAFNYRTDHQSPVTRE